MKLDKREPTSGVVNTLRLIIFTFVLAAGISATIIWVASGLNLVIGLLLASLLIIVTAVSYRLVKWVERVARGRTTRTVSQYKIRQD
jgi:hypothetical protein